jgi:hypothetical protein
MTGDTVMQREPGFRQRPGQIDREWPQWIAAVKVVTAGIGQSADRVRELLALSQSPDRTQIRRCRRSCNSPVVRV